MLALEKYKNWVPKNWDRVRSKDGTSVSFYGSTDPREDFAEAMRVYLITDGGAASPYHLERFRHRFEVFDRILNMPVRVRTQVLRDFQEKLDDHSLNYTTTASGGVFLIYNGSPSSEPQTDTSE